MRNFGQYYNYSSTCDRAFVTIIYFLVVFIESDFFPQLPGFVTPLDGLDVEIADSLLLLDGRVVGVRQRTRLTVAETGHVVLVLAEDYLLIIIFTFDNQLSINIIYKLIINLRLYKLI